MRTARRISPVQETAKKLQRRRNLRLPRNRMFLVRRGARQRPARGSNGLRSGGKGRAPLRQRQLLVRQRLRPGQVLLRQVRQQASKTCRLMRGPRRKSPIRKRCSRSKRSTRTSRRNQNRSRFRRLPTIRIIGFKTVEHWQGQQYEVFRSYHPEWHDQGWYHSHYNRVLLIGGGYYFWNAGYWYPAWGYSPSAAILCLRRTDLCGSAC